MEVSNLLTQDTPQRTRSTKASGESQPQQEHYHPYPTRNARPSYNHPNAGDRYNSPPAHLLYTEGQSAHLAPHNPSPPSPNQKHVAFELLLPESPNQRARLPMRVNIFPHDTTESIITTVKNFYGLYEGVGGARGVSFQDEDGNTLIARYENFRNNMTIYVRVVPHRQSISTSNELPFNHAASPVKEPHLGEAFTMPPPQSGQLPGRSQPPSRTGSRMAHQRSVSPQAGRGRRSVSASKMGRSRSGAISRGSSSHDNYQDGISDTMNGYSSDEGGQGSSVTSSRKARSEQLASAEISLDNILEGGRRKRAKFESSVSADKAVHGTSSLLTSLFYRSFLYLFLLKCLSQLQPLLYLHNDGMTIKVAHRQLRTLRSARSLSTSRSIRHRAGPLMVTHLATLHK